MGRLVTMLGIGVMLAGFTAIGEAQVGCPAEIGQAKELLSRKGGLRAAESCQPSLVQEAEAACKTGDLNTARARAEAAIAELQ